MKIVSTTLTGNSEAVIGEALLSACGHVDQCIVIDTGITDGTLAVARAAVGDQLVVRSFPWVNDFAAARNFALRCAEEAGADLALTLDSDERLLFGPGWAREEFADNPDIDVWYASHVDRSYMKERLLRPGRGICWYGPVHEHIPDVGHERKAVTVSLSFTELAKNPTQMYHKNMRDLAVLQSYAPEHPDEPRWWMYLGLTLANMGRNEEAIPPLAKAARMNRFAEFDGRYCVQRVARCCLNAGLTEQGLAFIEEAMRENPAEPQYGYFRKMLQEKRDLITT